MEDIDYVRLNCGAVFSSGSRPSERTPRRAGATQRREQAAKNGKRRGGGRESQRTDFVFPVATLISLRTRIFLLSSFLPSPPIPFLSTVPIDSSPPDGRMDRLSRSIFRTPFDRAIYVRLPPTRFDQFNNGVDYIIVVVVSIHFLSFFFFFHFFLFFLSLPHFNVRSLLPGLDFPGIRGIAKNSGETRGGKVSYPRISNDGGGHGVGKSRREEKYLCTRLVDTCRRRRRGTQKREKEGEGKQSTPRRAFIRPFVPRAYISRRMQIAGSNFFLKSPIRLAPLPIFLLSFFFFFTTKQSVERGRIKPRIVSG